MSFSGFSSRLSSAAAILFGLSLCACYSAPMAVDAPEETTGTVDLGQDHLLLSPDPGVASLEGEVPPIVVVPQAAQMTEDDSSSLLAFDRPPSIPDLALGKTAPPTPEEFNERLNQSGKRWLYGKGIGRTMANIGTVILFPPYALYLVGNAGLSLAGYEPLHVTDALPSTPRKYVIQAYDGVTSVPGRVTAFIAGKDFQTD